MSNMICAETGKRHYSSRSKAHHALRGVASKRGAKRVYQCQFCFGWHLTSHLSPHPKRIHKGQRRRHA